MTDRSKHTGDGEPERVVVRDRRRIKPVTDPAPAEKPEAAPDAAEAAPAAPVGPTAKEAELASEVEERTADLQRITAEYANYRRRVERDREGVVVSARVQFVNEMLTVLDDLERAESHGDLTGAFKSVAGKVVAVVQKQGLEAFGHEGEPFDPAVHEAVQHEPSDATGPTTTVVVSVLRRGYRIADRVLRPAMVAVTDRSDDGTTPATKA